MRIHAYMHTKQNECTFKESLILMTYIFKRKMSEFCSVQYIEYMNIMFKSGNT